MLASPEGRRRATQCLTVSFEHIPVEASAPAALPLDRPRASSGLEPRCRSYRLPALSIWWASSYREEWLPHADWVVLDGVRHCPQLDVPAQTAALILGHTSP